jgi:hypothetical protein
MSPLAELGTVLQHGMRFSSVFDVRRSGLASSMVVLIHWSSFGAQALYDYPGALHNRPLREKDAVSLPGDRSPRLHAKGVDA